MEEGDSKWRLIFLAMLLPSVLHLHVLFISRNVHSLYSKWLYVICTIVVLSTSTWQYQLTAITVFIIHEHNSSKKCRLRGAVTSGNQPKLQLRLYQADDQLSKD
jgi:hypothetical protein